MSTRYRFDRFVVDVDERQLLDGEEAVRLQPRTMDLLLALVRNPRTLMSRDELLTTVWPDVHVTGESLSQAIRRIRKALGGADLVTTVPKQGYRLDADVTVEGGSVVAAMPTVPDPGPVIGRQDLIAQVQAALERHRCAVLVGAAGAGKTTVARAVAAAWPGPAVEVALAGSTSPAQLVSALGAVLGVRILEPAHPSSLLALGTSASARPGLLVLLDGAQGADPSLVAALIEAAPGTAWLATARAGVALPGPVLPVGGLATADAVTLLERSAPDADKSDLAAVAAAIDGLPLALELAAARLRFIEPTELLRLLDDRFAVLRDAWSDRSLAAAMAATWDGLDELEQTALVRLSVVDTPIPVGAAREVLEPLAPHQHDVLQRLVDRAWIRVDRGWLEVPRNQSAWARAHGSESHALDAARRLGAWVAEHGFSRGEAALFRADRDALQWLHEHTPLLLATATSELVPIPPRDIIARIACSALQYRGPDSLIVEIADQVLAHELPTESRIRLLWLAGTRHRVGGRVQRAYEMALESIQLAEPTGDPVLVGGSWTDLADCLYGLGRRDEAMEAALKGRDIVVGQDPIYRAWSLLSLSRISRTPEDKNHILRQVLELPLPPLAWPRLSALLNLAVGLQDAGHLEEADAFYRERLQLSMDADPAMYRVIVLGNRGNIEAARGHTQAAIALYREAIEVASTGGMPRLANVNRLAWATTELEAGLLERARARAAAVLASQPDVFGELVSREVLAMCAQHADQPALALVHYDEGIARGRALSRTDLSVGCAVMAAGTRAALGRPDRAALEAAAPEVTSDPDRVALEWARGVTALALGERDEAAVRLAWLLAETSSGGAAPVARIPSMTLLIERFAEAVGDGT